MKAQLEFRSKSAQDEQKRKWKKVNKDATRCDRALRLRKDPTRQRSKRRKKKNINNMTGSQ